LLAIKVLIKTSKPILKQVRLALSKHLFIIIIVNKVIIFNMSSKNTSVINLNLFWPFLCAYFSSFFVSAYSDKESSKTNILEERNMKSFSNKYFLYYIKTVSYVALQ
jgi:hypothetical protein